MGKESLKLFESVEFDKGKLVSNNHYSNKMLGVVNAAVYKNGKKIRESIDTNEIIMPGSIFVLEQMFKTKYADRMNYNIPISVHTNSSQYPEIVLTSRWEGPVNINNEEIFGFMVGNGGASVDGKNVVNYDSKFLCDKKGNPSFIPFRVTDTAPNGYKFVVKSTDKDGANEKYFAYVKAFSEGPTICKDDDDGSIYAEMKLEITGDEFKEFYELEKSDDTIHLESFNQLGLVAGYNTGSTYDDIRLVTMINFQNYYLEDDEVLKMTYRIYSLQ